MSPLTRLVVAVSGAGLIVIAHSLAALATTPHAGAWIGMGAFAVIATDPAHPGGAMAFETRDEAGTFT